MGSNAPKYDYLRDQWEADIEDLTESDIKKSMNYMKSMNSMKIHDFHGLSWTSTRYSGQPAGRLAEFHGNHRFPWKSLVSMRIIDFHGNP